MQLAYMCILDIQRNLKMVRESSKHNSKLLSPVFIFNNHYPEVKNVSKTLFTSFVAYISLIFYMSTGLVTLRQHFKHGNEGYHNCFEIWSLAVLRKL